MWQFWIIITGFFLVLEMFTPGFLVFWIALAALATCLISLFISSVVVETFIFLVILFLLIIFTKPLVEKFMDKQEAVPTNADSIIGKKAIVTKTIDPNEAKGQIKVNGEVWSAKSADDTSIEKNTEVEIKGIDGVKAVVSKKV